MTDEHTLPTASPEQQQLNVAQAENKRLKKRIKRLIEQIEELKLNNRQLRARPIWRQF